MLDPLDIVLTVTLFITITSLLTTLCTGACLLIEKKDRCLLLGRSVIGYAGYTMMTFGVNMVPLSVQNTLYNTAPIWASILGYCFLNEGISMFESIALILSFGAVACIALSKDS